MANQIGSFSEWRSSINVFLNIKWKGWKILFMIQRVYNFEYVNSKCKLAHVFKYKQKSQM